PMEVGSIARVMTNLLAPGKNKMKEYFKPLFSSLKIELKQLNSVLGRHLCHALETQMMIEQCYSWLDELEVDGKPANDFKYPKSGEGIGLTEAPRGALGHWLKIKDYKISSYQCVVPTTWNCSPRDDKGTPGPVEKALEGTPIANPEHPLEAGRVVRSFDPCLACAIH
ncbi:MAG: nickel-dependent hydrogenase large subunit, partial [Planctomycetes bacterium]|nr:nickel-dependent hydrogenase large subunit [Planctomycetota bacterium]